MQTDQTNLINKMFEYHLWANTQLIEFCGNLTDEQLEVEAEGVFGRIHPTLAHTLRAEGNYLNRITGSRPLEEDLDWEALSLRDLRAMAQLSGEMLIDVAGKADPSVRHDVEFQDSTYSFFNWTVLLQALYHGIEHRTQIKFLLTQLGIEHPELAAWDYVDSISSD